VSSLLGAVLDQLGAHHAIDERESRCLEEARRVLPTLERPFDRFAGRTHVTGSGIVVGGRGVILHLHKRLGIWVQPGGHLDAGETPWDAARRESAEETGLTLRFAGTGAEGGEVPPLLHVDVHAGGQGHTHIDLRYLLAVVGDDRPAPPAGESQAVAWFSWEDALVAAEPALGGLLAHLRRSPAAPPAG